MVYFVGAIYGVVGHNMLAVQLVNGVIGAATAIIIFLCAQKSLPIFASRAWRPLRSPFIRHWCFGLHKD